MGMAASQARLLSLTVRLHDIERDAQNLMAQKIALATQKDGLYQEYCDALEATQFKVAYFDDSMNQYLVDANYNNLCTFQKDRCQQLYALRNNQTGNIYVSPQVAEAYEAFGGDKYAFAYAMLGYENHFNYLNEGLNYSTSYSGAVVGVIGACQGTKDIMPEESDVEIVEEDELGEDIYSIYMTGAEQIVYNDKYDEDSKLEEYYEEIKNADTKKDKQEALDKFRDYLYEKYSKDIYTQMNYNKQADYSNRTDEKLNPEQEWSDISAEFNYYVDLWTAIDEAGGCEVIKTQYLDGEEGNNWLKNMVECGFITIMAYDISGHKNEWTDTSFATSTNNNYLQEVSDDKALKKAEAEYEHELDIINRKDTKFDTELSKLETERKAITTQMESIDKVKGENIDRTFGIFS